MLRQTLARLPQAAGIQVRVTGRSPLDLDVRTVVARDSAQGEKRLLPLTLIILILAFGALVAALLPLVVGILAISISLAIIGVIARLTPMSVFRAQHDHDDRTGRRDRLFPAHRHPLPGGDGAGLRAGKPR